MFVQPYVHYLYLLCVQHRPHPLTLLILLHQAHHHQVHVSETWLCKHHYSAFVCCDHLHLHGWVGLAAANCWILENAFFLLLAVCSCLPFLFNLLLLLNLMFFYLYLLCVQHRPHPLTLLILLHQAHHHQVHVSETWLCKHNCSAFVCFDHLHVHGWVGLPAANCWILEDFFGLLLAVCSFLPFLLSLCTFVQPYVSLFVPVVCAAPPPPPNPPYSPPPSPPPPSPRE